VLGLLRDAALDLADIETGLAAQRAVLDRMPFDGVEWRRLGDLLATIGDITQARAAFARALQIAPGDDDVRTRLAALDAYDFDLFAVRAGFATPAGRRELRTARRGA
jgi:Flp pilus assembly protein TadD